MSKERRRTVYRRSDGLWVNESNDPQQSPRVLRTQREAVEEAKWTLMKEGGGTLTIVGERMSGDRRQGDRPARPANPQRNAPGQGGRQGSESPKTPREETAGPMSTTSQIAEMVRAAREETNWIKKVTDWQSDQLTASRKIAAYGGFRTSLVLANSALCQMESAMECRIDLCVPAVLRRPVIETFLKAVFFLESSDSIADKFFRKRGRALASELSCLTINRLIPKLKNSKLVGAETLEWIKKETSHLNDQAHGGVTLLSFGISEETARIIYPDKKLRSDIVLFAELAFKSCFLLANHICGNQDLLTEVHRRHRDMRTILDQQNPNSPGRES